jgi:hypothetical protein
VVNLHTIFLGWGQRLDHRDRFVQIVGVNKALTAELVGRYHKRAVGVLMFAFTDANTDGHRHRTKRRGSDSFALASNSQIRTGLTTLSGIHHCTCEALLPGCQLRLN